MSKDVIRSKVVRWAIKIQKKKLDLQKRSKFVKQVSTKKGLYGLALNSNYTSVEMSFEFPFVVTDF